MAPQEQISHNEDQFVISYELLALLQWLLQHEKQALQSLIKRAYTKGKDITSSANTTDFEHELRYTVADFFNFLEGEIAHVTQEHEYQDFSNSQLLKTLDHIDPMRFEQALIHDTIQKSAEKQPSAEQFLKELLKQWKPTEKNKKHSLN